MTKQADKFISFLESLKNDENKDTIEIVKSGFQTCLEGMDLGFQPTQSVMPLQTPFMNKKEEPEVKLKDEMTSYLKQQFKGLVDENEAEFDIEAAIYWFANDYHSGQWSELYSILSSQSQYRPGPDTTLESEGEMVKMFYEALEDKYGKKNI